MGKKGTPGFVEDIIEVGGGEDAHGLPGDDTIILSPFGGEGGQIKGGAGVDDLIIKLTPEEFLALGEDFATEYAAFLEHIENTTNPSGQATGQAFVFESLGGLKIKQIESVSVQIDGELYVSDQASGTLGNGQEVFVTLGGDGLSGDGAGDFDLTISFDAVIQPAINVVFVVDTSGSTQANVLAQEVAALKALASEIVALGYPDGAVTISIVPFDNSVDPNSSGNAITTFTLDASDDAGTTDLQDIFGALDDLEAFGYTDYIEALQKTDQLLIDLEASGGEATNLVYFLSDGRPTVRSDGNPGTPSVADVAAAAAPVKANAQVSAVEIGNINALQWLNVIDNTGGTTQINNPSDLTAALLGSPIPEGDILEADVFIFNDGVQTGSLALNPADFIESPLGFTYDFSLTGLADMVGEQSEVVLRVGIDGDGDGIFNAADPDDLLLEASVDVFGY